MFFRCAIFVGLSSVVATIIYLTPIPEQTFLSCDRPCHHLDWPMICRVKLTLEVFQSLSKSCGDCPSNITACQASHCVSADGHRRGILTANRQLPGPTIQVCENDILVVDVINRLPGKAAAVHWRGQSQIETPFMDGAPLITQCPISSYTTFQYKFRASGSGTHLWHAHAGADVTNGVIGLLLVKQADIRDPHRALYDIDDPNHVILVTPWQHIAANEISSNEGHLKPDILLVNGKGRQLNGPRVPLTTFTVIPGRRHRFRAANAGGAGTCPITISIDGHSLLLIALDGHPIEPLQVTSITIAKGERADFVLKAANRISAYWVNVRTASNCLTTAISGAAVLKYKGSSVENEKLFMPDQSEHFENKEVIKTEIDVTTNPTNKCSRTSNLCMTDLQNIRKMPKELTREKMDVTIYLPINFKVQASDFIANEGIETKVLNVGNSTFTYPSSPLLTQGFEVPENMFCSKNKKDEYNENNETSTSKRHCRRSRIDTGITCECVHVRYIPLGATVEIIFLDQGGLDDLVYHLHGYSFYVVAARKFGQSMSLNDIKDLNKKDQLFSRNLESAPLKDTVIIPKFSAVAIRFKANNPGYWMLRDEHAIDWTRGLDIILQVGDITEMISAPQDFPKCGSFVGPDYFLI